MMRRGGSLLRTLPHAIKRQGNWILATGWSLVSGSRTNPDPRLKCAGPWKKPPQSVRVSSTRVG